MLAEPAFFIRPSANDTLGQRLIQRRLFSRNSYLIQPPVERCGGHRDRLKTEKFMQRGDRWVESPSRPMNFTVGLALRIKLNGFHNGFHVIWNGNGSIGEGSPRHAATSEDFVKFVLVGRMISDCRRWIFELMSS